MKDCIYNTSWGIWTHYNIFGLTNTLATFQVIMNNILRDLIDIGDIVVFINDILVEIEDKKKHNKIVEEVLKRIETNNLYLKPEKCM